MWHKDLNNQREANRQGGREREREWDRGMRRCRLNPLKQRTSSVSVRSPHNLPFQSHWNRTRDCSRYLAILIYFVCLILFNGCSMVLWSRGMTLCHYAMHPWSHRLWTWSCSAILVWNWAFWLREQWNWTSLASNWTSFAENLEVGPNSQHMRNINVQALLEK